MLCPACAVEVPEGDLFCEECGSRVSPAASLAACGCGASAGEIDEDGFCQRCGLRMRRAAAADHIEQALSATFAAVSDRGLRHDRNEDRVAIFEGAGAYAMVVCDGVSSSQQSELASAAVAEGALVSLTAALASASAEPFDAEAAVRRAIADGARGLVAQGIGKDHENPASTTVVAALVRAGEVVVGWLGDSRAYWIDGSGAKTLTRDHSWMNEAITQQGMSPERAAASPQAHAITRWIGADSVEEADAETVRHAVRTPGMLLLCTDGLWNYVAAEEAMAKLVRETAADGRTAIEIARGLVQFANGRGGQDNITAAVLQLEQAR